MRDHGIEADSRQEQRHHSKDGRHRRVLPHLAMRAIHAVGIKREAGFQGGELFQGHVGIQFLYLELEQLVPLAREARPFAAENSHQASSAPAGKGK